MLLHFNHTFCLSEFWFHSLSAMSATKHVWRLSAKPNLTSASFRGLPLPTFQLNDANMEASVEEIGPERTHTNPWTHKSEVHESTKRTVTVNVCNIPRIWQTYDANVTHFFPLRLLIWPLKPFWLFVAKNYQTYARTQDTNRKTCRGRL